MNSNYVRGKQAYRHVAVYLGKIYTPIVFGDAAPSVPSFIGSKVIFWWKSFVRSAGHIS